MKLPGCCFPCHPGNSTLTIVPEKVWFFSLEGGPNSGDMAPVSYEDLLNAANVGPHSTHAEPKTWPTNGRSPPGINRIRGPMMSRLGANSGSRSVELARNFGRLRSQHRPTSRQNLYRGGPSPPDVGRGRPKIGRPIFPSISATKRLLLRNNDWPTLLARSLSPTRHVCGGKSGRDG